MNANPKRSSYKELMNFVPLFGLLFMWVAQTIFAGDLQNTCSLFTSRSAAPVIGSDLLLSYNSGRIFKNASFINSQFSHNNTSRPESLTLYRDTFLLDKDEAAGRCGTAAFVKYDYGGDQCREIYCNNFNKVLVRKCIFSAQYITECDFKAAKVDSTSFVNCQFMYCDFTDAVLDSSVIFKDCQFFNCVFRNTQFSSRVENAIGLNDCDLYKCDFSPGNLDSAAVDWKSNHNVFYIKSQDFFIKGKLEKMGLKEEVKYVAAAERKERLLRHANRGQYFTQHFLRGNFLDDYGTNPTKPLLPLLFLLPIFFLIYYKMSFRKCIFLTWRGSLKNKGDILEHRRNVNWFANSSTLKRVQITAVFTFISCFVFGFSIIKGLDFQAVIAAFQKRNVVFISEGAVKRIAGFQSLLVFICVTLSIMAMF